MQLAVAPCQAPMADPYEELARLNEQYTEILNLYDTVIRAARNPKMSAIYFRLFVSLLEDHPELLECIGQQFEIDISLVRYGAGEGDKESNTTRFFKDMSTAGAFEYQSWFDKVEGRRRSFVVPFSSFPYPENLDTNGAAKKRRQKEEEEKKKNQFKNPRQLFECEVCHSSNLVYDATARCLDCKHVHEPIKDIPVSDITIEGEVHEIADDAWLNEWDTPTAEVQTIRIQQQQLPETPRPAPVTFGPSPRGIACPDCHSLNHWYAVPTEWGGTIYNCGVCMPPEGV